MDKKLTLLNQIKFFSSNSAYFEFSNYYQNVIETTIYL